MDLKQKSAPLAPERKAQEMASAVTKILEMIGEDPMREGLRQTPGRVARAFDFLTSGYHQDPYRIINDAVFAEEADEMIVVKDIEIYSLCEHHLLPFFGKAHVAYIPNGRVIGLSKIARLVEVYARRLQLQERLTNQIAAVLSETLKPAGVAVVIEAAHMCMQMRGVRKQGSTMVTSAMVGAFKDNLATRTEFMQFIKG
jgi:GTP cyclohydrolase I